MDKCRECDRNADWNCIICSVLLCSTHKRTHNDDEQEHSFKELNLKLPEDLKHKVFDSVGSKIRLIDQFSNQIIKTSEIIIEQLSIQSKTILINLEDQKKQYLQILHLLDTEINKKQLKMIEKQISAVLVYEKCESREVHRWYEQGILKETTSASNRKKEFFRLGRDLAQEVLKNALTCLEASNIYVGETGTIEGVEFVDIRKAGSCKKINFIYHGEIENGLRHGRGNCYYETGDIYDGEFQNGKLEGRGVYQWDNGNIYDGECKAGKAEGRGSYKHASGGAYGGGWRTDLKKGRELVKYASGDAYDGEWRAMKRGRGISRSASDFIYDGEGKAEKRKFE